MLTRNPGGRMMFPIWRRSSGKILSEVKREAVGFLESLQPALKGLVGENLLLVVPAAERLVYWILTETGRVNLEALRRHLPPGDLRLETLEAFREAVRRKDRPHLRALRKHLYAVGNRQLLSRLLAKKPLISSLL